MTTCPSPDCQTTVECDACLDAHLREVHGTTYTASFGPSPSTWLSVCSRHDGVPVQRLGGVEYPVGA